MVRNSDKCVPLPPFIELRFFLFFFYSCDLFLGSDGDYLESRSTFYDTSEAGACQRFCRPSGVVSRWEVLTDKDDSWCQSVGFRGKYKPPLNAGPGSNRVRNKQSGVCQRTIDRGHNVQSVTWMPNCQGFISVEGMNIVMLVRK